MKNTKIEAQGRWFDILSNYIDSKILDGKHHACPLCCEGKDRFRWDNKDDNGGYICGQCGSGTGIHLIAQHQGINHADAWRLVERVIGSASKIEKPAEIDMKARIVEILKTHTVPNENVINYMLSRGLETPVSLFSGRYYFEKNMTDCMIAKVSKGNKLVGLHATYIQNGEKIGRRMYSVEKGSMMGGAVRLHKLNGGDAIVIGEGIESSLSAAMVTGLPAWAALDAGKLEVVEIPDVIKRVVIAADNDLSYTGQRSAYILAHRLHMQGKQVEVIIPEIKGEDFNDYHKTKVAN